MDAWENLLDAARKLAYQHRRPVAVVVDAMRGLVLFVGPTAGYLESEPFRYRVVAEVFPAE